MSVSILFIVHGKIRIKKKLISKIHQVFNGYAIIVQETLKAGDARKMTRAAILQDSRFIIAVGGDGTINEVANGFMESFEGNKAIMGILPFGRGNDFVRTFPVTTRLESLLHAINTKNIKRVDIGKLIFSGLSGRPEQRYFINIADVGIGGVVAQEVKSKRRFYSSGLIYLLAIIRSLFKVSEQYFKVRADNFSFTGEVMSICMANGKYFGSGICIAPQANLHDGKAEIVIVEKVNVWEFLMYLPKLRKEAPIHHPKIIYLKSTSCSIDAQEPCAIDVDGEFVGHTPLEMAMVPNALPILLTAD